MKKIVLVILVLLISLGTTYGGKNRVERPDEEVIGTQATTGNSGGSTQQPKDIIIRVDYPEGSTEFKHGENTSEHVHTSVADETQKIYENKGFKVITEKWDKHLKQKGGGGEK